MCGTLDTHVYFVIFFLAASCEYNQTRGKDRRRSNSIVFLFVASLSHNPCLIYLIILRVFVINNYSYVTRVFSDHLLMFFFDEGSDFF
mgnify:FL=1